MMEDTVKLKMNTATTQQSSIQTRLREIIPLVLNYILLISLAIFFLFPLAFMFVSSFKAEKAIFDDLQTIIWAFIPRNITPHNFDAVFQRVPFWRYLFNSAFITATTIGLSLIINSMIAFSLARLSWPGKTLILSAIVALIIVPLEAIAVPLLVIVNSLPWIDGSIGWLDTYHVQILPFVADAFSIFLFYQFFIGLPKDYDEAARIDGAGPFQIYRTIAVPLSKPVFATVAILQMLVIWNGYLWPLITTRGEQVRPLPIGITAFYVHNIKWGPILAFATLATIPMLIGFLLFQKWFMRSVAASGIKG